MANHYKMAPLAERVTKLLEAKFDQADEEVEGDEKDFTFGKSPKGPDVLDQVRVRVRDRVG